MSSLRDIADSLTVEAVLVACGIEPPTRDGRIRCPIHSGEGRNFGIIPDDPCRWRCFSRGCGSEARRDAVNLMGYLRYGGPIKSLPRSSKVDLLRLCEDMTGLKLDDGAKYGQDADRESGLTPAEKLLLARYITKPQLLSEADSDDFETVAGQMALVWLQSCIAMGRTIDRKLLELYISKRGWNGNF